MSLKEINSILLLLNKKMVQEDHKNVFTINELHQFISNLTGKSKATVRNTVAYMCETLGYIKYDMLGVFYITELGMKKINELVRDSLKNENQRNVDEYDKDYVPY